MIGARDAALPALAAGGAAVLLAAALPPAPLAWLAPFAFVLLALALARCPPGAGGARAAAGVGALFAGTHSGLALHWIPFAAAPYTPPGPIGGAVAFGVGLAFWSVHALAGAAVFAAVHRSAVGGPLPLVPAFALGWAVLEWLPGAVPLVGVPWPALATAWVDHPRLAAATSISGAVAAAALLAGTAAGVGVALARAPSGRSRRELAWAGACLVCLLALGLLAARGETLTGREGGAGRAAASTGPSTARDPTPSSAGLGVVALAMPRELIADREGREASALRAVRGAPGLGEREPGSGPEVWPEAPVGLVGGEEGDPGAGEYRRALAARAQGSGRPIVAGLQVREEGRVHNAVARLEAGGAVHIVHRKRRLVPWIERTALVRAGESGRGLAPGGPARPVRVGGTDAGILVCFEILFAADLARLRRDGARVLVQVTGDAALTDGARAQHLAHLRLRAAELRMPAFRSAFGGRAGGWDAHGQPLTPVSEARGEGTTHVEYRFTPAGPPPPAAVLGPAIPPLAALVLFLASAIGAARPPRARTRAGPEEASTPGERPDG